MQSYGNISMGRSDKRTGLKIRRKSSVSGNRLRREKLLAARHLLS